jgi:hypothetical protein
MQLPSIERIPTVRPSGADVASVAAARVLPVAPVNPTVTPAQPSQTTPSVINLVNQANKPGKGEAVYSSVSDPTQRGSEAATPAKDWTIHRPAPVKVQDPPPVPLSKVLLDHIKSLWAASASAVQVQQHVKGQLEVVQSNTNVNPNAMPGVLAKEVLTYSPSKITKTEKT